MRSTTVLTLEQLERHVLSHGPVTAQQIARAFRLTVNPIQVRLRRSTRLKANGKAGKPLKWTHVDGVQCS